MYYKSIPDVEDGFGGVIPACREYTFPRADERTRAFPAVRGGTVIGPVIEAHIVKLRDKYGSEINIPSPNRPERTSWVVICRGSNKFVSKLHLQDPRHALPSPEWLKERLWQKESDFSLWIRRKLASRQLVREFTK